jgi:hypothetical protein
MKILLWILFITVLSILVFKGSVLKSSGNGIIELELAEKKHAIQILSHWSTLSYGDTSFLETAKSQTRWDFVFICTYVLLMISMSNWQMQREKSILLNELLRFNLFAITIAGIFDVIENICIFHNLHHISYPEEYWGTHIVAMVKFIFAIFSILVFIISFIKSLLFDNN